VSTSPSPAPVPVDTATVPVKPLLRGWLHAVTFPLAVTAGATLALLVHSTRATIALAVFTVCSALLFGVSAIYHRGSWSAPTKAVLRRLDHANIFLLIAGTYTPLGLLLLHGRDEIALLTLVWGGALLGVIFRIFWLGAPRWLYVPVYLGIGWGAAWFIPDFVPRGGVAVVTLVVVGGLLYSLGAVVYGLRKPDVAPRVFGFHEVFHSLTVLGFASHVVAIGLALSAVGAFA
jgi:hemolysin III